MALKILLAYLAGMLTSAGIVVYASSGSGTHAGGFMALGAGMVILALGIALGSLQRLERAAEFVLAFVQAHKTVAGTRTRTRTRTRTTEAVAETLVESDIVLTQEQEDVVSALLHMRMREPRAREAVEAAVKAGVSADDFQGLMRWVTGAEQKRGNMRVMRTA